MVLMIFTEFVGPGGEMAPQNHQYSYRNIDDSSIWAAKSIYLANSTILIENGWDLWKFDEISENGWNFIIFLFPNHFWKNWPPNTYVNAEDFIGFSSARRGGREF